MMFLYIGLFKSIDDVRTHVENALLPARHAGEVEKWMETVDFAATAKAFQINVVVCSPLENGKYQWTIYAPELTSSVFKNVNKKCLRCFKMTSMEQNKECPQFFCITVKATSK